MLCVSEEPQMTVRAKDGVPHPPVPLPPSVFNPANPDSSLLAGSTGVGPGPGRSHASHVLVERDLLQ